MKLTQLGFDIDEERTLDHLGRLAERAAQDGGVVWIDMEGSAYTERTISLYERLRARHPNVGICLQAYLRRSAADVARLLPLDPAIRLVKGAYDEPPRSPTGPGARSTRTTRRSRSSCSLRSPADVRSDSAWAPTTWA